MIFGIKFSKIWAVLLLCCSLIPGAAAEEFGAVSVELLPPLVSISVSGAPMVSHFRITNNGYKPAEVELRCDTINGRVSRSFLIPQKSSINSDLALPGLDQQFGYGISGGSKLEFQVTVDGKKYLSKKLYESGIFTPYSRKIEQKSLGANELAEDAIKYLFGNLDYKSIYCKAELAAEQWPADLRIYMPFKYIWLNSEYLPPAETMKVLRDWVGLGGTLIVDVKPGKAWPEGVPGADEGFNGENIGCGNIYTARIFRAGGQDAFESCVRPKKGSGYFGGDDLVNLLNINNFKENTSGMLEHGGVKLFETIAGEIYGVEGTKNNFISVSDEDLLTDVLSLPQVPAALVVLLLIVFVLLIGPVNYLYFKKRHQELMVLISTPIISFIGCGAVILLISINEGWYSRGVSKGVTVLDQLTNQAYSSSATVLYSPSGLNETPSWANDEIIIFRGMEQLDAGLQQGNAQVFESSLLKPRIPLVIESLRAESRKEQLKIVEQKSVGGEVVFEVVNGLGKEIKSLMIAGRTGNTKYEKSIASGERLKFSGKNFQPDDGTEPFSIRILALRLSNGDRVEPWNIPSGYYVAKLEDIVFYSPGVTPTKFETTQYVIGKFEDIKNAD